MPEISIRIDLNDDADRWRYRCPAGHTQWTAVNHHFWCAACAKGWQDVDPVFEELHDLKTGETIHRDRIAFVEKRPSPIWA